MNGYGAIVARSAHVDRRPWNKSKNTGITSVDRSTKATLSTYNPWIQVSRLQKIYHFQHKKLIFTKHTLPFKLVHMQKGRDLMLVL